MISAVPASVQLCDEDRNFAVCKYNDEYSKSLFMCVLNQLLGLSINYFKKQNRHFSYEYYLYCKPNHSLTAQYFPLSYSEK